MAWIELLIGIVALVVGVVLMLGAANTPAPNAETDRYAVIGLIVGAFGALVALMGFIQLSIKLVNAVFG